MKELAERGLDLGLLGPVEQRDQGRGPHDRRGILEQVIQPRGPPAGRLQGAERRAPHLGRALVQEPPGQRHEVAAAAVAQEGQRADDDLGRRVEEQERRDEPRPAAHGQEVQRGQHHRLVVAGHAGHQGLERVEVERRHRDPGLDRPLVQPAPEQLHVGAPDGGDAGKEPGHQPEQDEGEVLGRDAERQAAQDRQGRDRLAQARAGGVDGHLVPLAQPARQREVEQLDAGPLQRVAERAVEQLEEQDGQEAGRQAEPDRGAADQDRQGPERPVDPQVLEQPAGREELDQEGDGVERGVEEREERAELIGRDGGRHGGLEQEVGGGDDHLGQRDQDEEPAEVRVTERAGRLGGRRSTGPGRGGRARPPRGRRQRAGHAQGRRADEDEIARRELEELQGGAGHRRAQRGADEPARPDDGKGALGLGRVELVADQGPELDHRDRRDQSGPGVKGVDRADAAGGHEPEERRDRGRAEQGQRDDRAAREPPGHDLVQAGGAERERRDREIDPGQSRGRDRREEHGVARRLEHRVPGQEAEERGERGEDPARDGARDAEERGHARVTVHASCRGR